MHDKWALYTRKIYDGLAYGVNTVTKPFKVVGKVAGNAFSILGKSEKKSEFADDPDVSEVDEEWED